MCSGHDTCLNCVDRGIKCVYDSEPRRRRAKVTRRQENDSRSDGADSQAGGQASPYQNMFPVPGRMSPVETQHVERLNQTFDCVNGSSAQHSLPDAAQVTSFHPESTAIATNHSGISLAARYESLGTPGVSSYPLQLPAVSERARLHRQYFDSFHIAYPFLDEDDMEMRLSPTLDRLGCPNNMDTALLISIDSETSTFMAMVCAAWALAQNTLRTSPTTENAKSLEELPGHAMYTTSKNLLQAFEGANPPSLDTVRCHLLNTIYALRANMVDCALQSHAIAARLLIIADSPGRNTDGQDCNTRARNLWWTIYILDRTLSRVSDVPYLLYNHRLPHELHRALEAPKWQRQMCDSLPLTSPHSTLHVEQSKDIAGDIDDLYLQVVAYVCHLWSSFTDGIHSDAPRYHRCLLREAALLDMEHQILDAALPSSLQSELLLTPGTQVTRQASDACRCLSIQLATNSSRLFLRDGRLMKCTCVGKINPRDGLNIARDTIRDISAFKSKHNTDSTLLSGIAVIATTALFQSISLLIDVLNQESGTQDSENISHVIEEGYAVLMDLASTCRFANSSILTLDKILFPSEDETDGRTSGSPPSPSSRLDGSHIGGECQILAAELDTAAPEGDESLGDQSVEVSKFDSLLDGLQVGYSDLDMMPPTRCPEPGWGI